MKAVIHSQLVSLELLLEVKTTCPHSFSACYLLSFASACSWACTQHHCWDWGWPHLLEWEIYNVNRAYTTAGVRDDLSQGRELGLHHWWVPTMYPRVATQYIELGLHTAPTLRMVSHWLNEQSLQPHTKVEIISAGHHYEGAHW